MAIEGYGDNDARTYKDNDIDSDGDGIVDEAEDVVNGINPAVVWGGY